MNILDCFTGNQQNGFLVKKFRDKFPIELPTSSFPETKHPIVKLEQLFRAPGYDELLELGVGHDGTRNTLNIEQLEELRKRGEFSVPSKRFPNQVHLILSM
jgi:hypothetical protein